MIRSFLTNIILKANTSLILNGQGVSGVETGTSKFQNNSLISLLDGTIMDRLNVLWTLIMKLFILIGRFMLNAIEFLMVFVNQFLGLNNEYKTMSDLTEDKIFSFLLNENVLKVVRYVAVVGIILIILFSIISIVKSEYQNAIGDSGNSKGRILVNALKALFLMVLIPLICIASIIFSNALLTSVYRATNGGQNVNVSTLIWESSTYTANAYRSYADEGYVKPILFNFTNTNDDGQPVSYTTISTDGTLSDIEKALIEYQNQSVFIKGFKTWAMFKSNSFLTFDELAGIENIAQTNGQDHSAYYDVYDNGLYFKRAEYYVMADAIDYFVEKNNSTPSGFFFKSINEIYEYNARVHGATTITDLPIEKVSGGYQVKVHYSGETEDKIYFSPENTSDEALGTVYTLCYAKQYQPKNGPSQEIYVPLINGIDGFKTPYSTSGSLVIARGVFDQEHNPTAIRTRDDGTVQFYRDDLNIPELVDFFPTISYELPEGRHEVGVVQFFRWGLEKISGLDSSEFIPYVYINFDIFEIFTKAQKNIVQVPNGNFIINYNMSDKSFSTYNFYREDKINPVVLLFAGAILMGMLITIIFGLVARIFNMVLLAITYPAVVSTITLDGGGGALNSWIKKFTDCLVCVFGIVIAFNVVLILVPIIWKIDFFTEEFMIEKMGKSVFFGTWTARLLNLMVRLMFTLVGFSMIKTFSKWVESSLMGGGGSTLLDEGDKLKGKFVEGAQTLGNVISGQIVFDTFKKGAENVGRLTDFIPGKAVYTVGKDIAMSHNRKKAFGTANDEINEAKQQLTDAVNSGSTTAPGAADAAANAAVNKAGHAGNEFDKSIKYNKVADALKKMKK